MTISQLKKGALLLIDGLDVSKPAEYIGESASPNNQNFTVESGLLTKRVGTVQSGDSMGEEVMLGTEFKREGSTYNIRIGPTKIQRLVATTWTDIGHTAFTGGTDDLFDIAIPLLSGKQILVVTNGVDSMCKWTASGNTTALGGSPPVPKFIQEYKTYLVAAHILGGVDVDTRVQWSDTGSPETWGSGNAGAVDLEEDGGEITGMNIFGNYLAIHKQGSIYLGYLVSTTAIFKFDRKATGAGTCANNSIVNLPTGEQIFLATDGIRIFNGISAPLLDSPVNDEIRNNLNNEKRHKAWGFLVREKDEAWLGIPIGDDPTGSTIYKFNYIKRVLYKDNRENASAAWRAARSESITWDDAVRTWDEQTTRWNSSSFSANFPLIYLGFNDGTTTSVNNSSTDDNGEAIEAFWESKDYQSDDRRMCRWQQIELDAKGGSVKVEYSVDSGITWHEIDNSPIDLMDEFPTDDDPIIGDLDVVSSKIRFRFTNNELGETLAIKQFIIGYLPREARR